MSFAAMNSTTIFSSGAYSGALFGMCRWTTQLGLCLGTVLPLAFIIVSLVIALVVYCYRTPQMQVLERAIPMHYSPFIPLCFRDLSPPEVSQVVACVCDIPLKSLLPRIGLNYVVEPCATMGVASVRDMLRMNRLAQRDVGIGLKETRVIMRALERRIKARQKAKQQQSQHQVHR